MHCPPEALVRLGPGTFRRAGEEVLFAADVFPQDTRRKRRIWVRTIRIPPTADSEKRFDGATLESLERLLERSRERVQSGMSMAEQANDAFRAAGSRRAVIAYRQGPPLAYADPDTVARFAVRAQAVASPITRR